MPLFAGMIPGTEGKATLPRGFSPAREEPPISMDFENRSIEDQTVEAVEEWHEIRGAFSVLADCFGPDFQALGPECSQPIQTPFGPALQYRTYGIGGIWMSYYMGLILCHRAHPSMPPAAMMAAGVAARETAYFANEIGRIAAGIAPNSSVMAHVHTGVGAGLIESTFALFVAGIQVREPNSNPSAVILMHLTVSRLRTACLARPKMSGYHASHGLADSPNYWRGLRDIMDQGG
jgi:hypothetical protein